MLPDLAFNAVIEYLSPADYDGKAMLSLSASDPRLRVQALLAWEFDNVRVSYMDVLQPLVQLLSNLKARDKVARLLQYVCRLLQVALQRTGQHQALVAKLRTVVTTFAQSRRSFRILEMGPLVSIVRGVSTSEPFWQLAYTSVCCSAAFNILDRWRWLQDHQLLTGDPRFTGRLALRFLCACHAASGLTHALRAHGAASVAGDEARDRVRRNLAGAFKQFLCFLQAGHIGRVPGLRTTDNFVTVLGVYTTALDLRDLWRASRQRRPAGVE